MAVDGGAADVGAAGGAAAGGGLAGGLFCAAAAGCEVLVVGGTDSDGTHSAAAKVGSGGVVGKQDLVGPLALLPRRYFLIPWLPQCCCQVTLPPLLLAVPGLSAHLYNDSRTS